MKVEVTTKEKQFEPIELKLTIESKEDLLELYNTLGNASGSYVLFDVICELKDKYVSYPR